MKTPKTPENFGADEAPTPLGEIGSVRRALARTLRRIESGTLDHAKGQVLINGYGTLFKMFVDAREARWLPRVKELWRERSAQQRPGASVQ